MATRRRMRETDNNWAATYIEWESVEDSYEHGEQDNSQTVLSESIFVKATSPAALIKKLSSTYGLPQERDNWAAFDGRLTCEFMVDDDNVPPTDREVEAWKTGRKRLWAAHVNVGVARVSVPTTEEIAEAFGVEDMGGSD